MSTASVSISTSNSKNGILSLLIALFFFSFQDIIVKHLSGDFSILQLLFVRSLFALIVLSIIARVVIGPQAFIAKQPRLLCIRGLLVVVCILLYYLAIPVLPLADIAGIVFSSPIIITMLSVIVLKEKVKLGHWLAIIFGFSGVLLIANPTGDFYNAGVLLALTSALIYSVMSIVTRQINHGDHPITIAIYSLAIYVVCCLLGLLIIRSLGLTASAHPSLNFLLREWIMPNQQEGLLFICLGFVGTIGFYYIAKAYQIAPSSHVAPFEYVYIVFVVILAFIFFAEVPKTTTYLGVGILIISGLYIWHLDRKS